MKAGDMVVIKKSSLDKKTSSWFRRFSEQEILMLVLSMHNEFAECLRPDGSSAYITQGFLEVISESR